MKFTPELMAKAKEAKSAEELLTLAKDTGIELTAEEAERYYNRLHATGELADDELDNVSGGCGGGGGSETPTRKEFYSYRTGDYVQFRWGEEIYEGTVVGARVGYLDGVQHPEYQIEFYLSTNINPGNWASAGYYPSKMWFEERKIIGITPKRF